MDFHDMSDFDSVDVEPKTPTQAKAPKVKPRAVQAPQGAAPMDSFFAQPTAQAPAPATVPLDPAKVPSVISKMRRIFAVSESKIEYVPIYVPGQTDPSFTVGLRPIGHDDYEWAVKRALAACKDSPDARIEEMMWTTATMAIGIATLDEGPLAPGQVGTPIWKAFEIEPKDSSYIRNANYPYEVVRFAAADMMFAELRGYFQDFVTVIISEYKVRVDPKVMIRARQILSPQAVAQTDDEEMPENPTT